MALTAAFTTTESAIEVVANGLDIVGRREPSLGATKSLSQQRLIALGALGGTRTPTVLPTATSRQRVYQFRHEREGMPA